MVPRELICLLATLSVATAAVTAAAAAAAAAAASVAAAAAPLSSSIDFDLAADYDSIADNDDLTDNNSASSQDSSSSPRKSSQQHEVRCYCNQPHCVSQGYMCRGRGCFTELPPMALVQASLKSLHLLHSRPETAGFSGCFDDKLNVASGGSSGNGIGGGNGKSSCPPGKLCCEQDLCNHVDSPALRARLNKTLQVLIGEHHQQNHLNGGGTSVSSTSTSTVNGGQQQSDGWFRTLTIAVPICGFVMLLILASLAIRMLQPLPTQSDKLQGLQPPLLPPTATVTTTHHCHRHFRQHLAPNKMPLV